MVPAPAVEFRMVAGAEVDVAVAADQTQKIPNLFLSAIRTAPFAAHPVTGNVITQPVARTANDFAVLRPQADFFVQLAVHGGLRAFARLDAALRELPRMFAHPLAPKDFVAVVD